MTPRSRGGGWLFEHVYNTAKVVDCQRYNLWGYQRTSSVTVN